MAWSFRSQGGCLAAKENGSERSEYVELAPLTGATFACLIGGNRVELVGGVWHCACRCDGVGCRHLMAAVELWKLWETLQLQAANADGQDLAARSVPTMLAEGRSE